MLGCAIAVAYLHALDGDQTEDDEPEPRAVPAQRTVDTSQEPKQVTNGNIRHVGRDCDECDQIQVHRRSQLYIYSYIQL